VDILERHLQEAQRKVETGIAPEEFSARADLALQQAQLQLQSARRGRKVACLILAEFIGYEGKSEALLLDALPGEVPEFASTSDLVGKALAHREELVQLSYQKDVMAELIGVSQAEYYPSLVAFGALNYGRPGIDRFANEWMFYQTAGISLNWTLWDWNKRSRQVQQVKVSDRQLDQSHRALQSRVGLEVETAEQMLYDAKGRYNLALESLTISGKIMTWVKERYQQGVATETEYLDAADDLIHTEIQKTVAIADYLLSLVQLRRACGTEVLE
jgi:outer membrane protein TolC